MACEMPKGRPNGRDVTGPAGTTHGDAPSVGNDIYGEVGEWTLPDPPRLRVALDPVAHSTSDGEDVAREVAHRAGQS